MDDNEILKTPNLEVKYSTLNPGDTVPKHYHPQGEDLFIVIDGKMRVILDEIEYTLVKGDYVFQQAGSRETFVEILEPTTIIAIRTPSIPDNKIVE